MIHIKLFESFSPESGITDLNIPKYQALNYMFLKNKGQERFTKRELDLFGKRLIKTDKLDFYKRTDVYKDKKRFKVLVWFKNPDSVGSKITFYKFKQDYYLAVMEIAEMSAYSKCFEIDTIEDLNEWIDQIPKYHNELVKLVDSHKLKPSEQLFLNLHEPHNESITTEQAEDISDLFVEVADEYGLIEITGQEKDKGNGFWRISKFPFKIEFYVILDSDSGVNKYAFETTMVRFMNRLTKLGYRYTKEDWGRRFAIGGGSTYNIYQADIWGFVDPQN